MQEDKLFYRELNSEEQDEIARLSTEANNALCARGESDCSDVLNTLNQFVNEIRVDEKDEDIIEKYAYELGSLYGNLINEKYNWQWYYLEKEGDVYYCVCSKNLRVCCAVHNYIYSILTNNHNNNLKLLFNMIKTEYPKDWRFTFLT